MDRLLYATPTGGHPKHKFCASLRALELGVKSFGVRGVEDFVHVVAPVQMARSKIAELAISRGYDYLVMHDDDMVLHPSDNLYGVTHPLDAWHEIMAAQPDVGMIGAVYMRERPMMPNVTMPHPRWPEEQIHVVCGYPAEPFQVAGIGTGFVMIRVSAMAELAEREVEDGAPPLFRFPLVESRWGLVLEVGEDYDFCRRLTDTGYKVLADPRVRTVHLKERGELAYDHARWEAACAAPDSASMAEIRANCAPTIDIVKLPSGLTVLDHAREREMKAAHWRAHLRKAA